VILNSGYAHLSFFRQRCPESFYLPRVLMLIFIIMGKVLFISFIYAVTTMNSGISISSARIIIIVQMLI
ncbi:hypothetical protein C5K19_04625, partial [Shigella flexneri]